jgi:hypothetical protein
VQKQALVCLALSIAILVCISREAVKADSEENTLRPVNDSIMWEDITFQSFTPCSVLELSGEDLLVFPYCDNDAYITVKKVLISDNGFWDTVVSEITNEENIRNCQNYSYVTLSNGTTLGYLPIDDESAYVCYTSVLPSSYVESTLDILWSTSL